MSASPMNYAGHN